MKEKQVKVLDKVIEILKSLNDLNLKKMTLKSKKRSSIKLKV